MKNADTRGDTLGALLERAAHYPETGLRFLDRRERARFASWAEIHAVARRVAASLAGLGIAPGDRIALVYATGPDFFHAFFGTVLLGAVPVPLYPPVRLGRLDEYHRRTAAMLRAADARLVLAESRVRRLLGTAVALAEPVHGCRTLADLPPADGMAVTPAKPEDLALVQFSSGTTVDPKPVALSHRAVVTQTRLLNALWPDTVPSGGIRGGDTVSSPLESPQGGTAEIRHSGVSWLPLYHDMGLIGCVFPALERPGVLTLLGPEVFVTRPASWLRAISRYRATVSVAPNFAYGFAADKIRDDELEGVDLGSWRIALNGAEPVAPAVLRRFERRFAAWGFNRRALTPVYGLSEASLAVTFSEIDQPFHSRVFDREELGRGRAVTSADGLELPSLGKPLPGFEIRIDGRDGGDVGRVLVRGPSLMEGYLGQSEATARVLRDGWLDTGDLGFLAGGELYLTGRAKDIVILRGRNYVPSEIEHGVDGVDGVRRGCAVAVSHAHEGAASEELLLFVESARDASAEVCREMPARCADAVLGTVGLDAIVHVLAPGTLPRTSSGKLRRGETLRLHLAGELVAPRRVTPLLIAGAMASSARAYRRLKKGKARHG